jgi:hypothetical protein
MARTLPDLRRSDGGRAVSSQQSYQSQRLVGGFLWLLRWHMTGSGRAALCWQGPQIARPATQRRWRVSSRFVIDRKSTHYGRTREEWKLLVDAGRDFLVEQARLGRVTSYTELNTVLR